MGTMTEDVNHRNQEGGSSSAGESAAVQDLRRRLAKPGPWANRFRQLADAIAHVDNVTCEECQALLDVYVDAERAGRAVRRHYPDLWHHLQTCADCAEVHDLLLEALEPAAEDALEPLPRLQPPRLSFLEPAAPEAPWHVRLRSRLAGAPFGLTFTLTPAHLQDLLAPAQPLPARTRRAGRPEPIVLLAGAVPLGGGQVGVEVIAVPDAQPPKRLELRATIAGTAPLPEHLWATLRWGDETRAGAVDEQGQADLGEMPLAALRAALDADDQVFEVTFEERREQT